MLDEAGRRRKAAKILAVLRHVRGLDDLSGLTAADVGCSAGFIADELAGAGAARTYGVDIDVPGLRAARTRFGDHVQFVCSAGQALPFPDASLDVVVFNHIYEHVVDPDAVIADVKRVLKPDGVLYLGLGNRLGVIEPHYKLPFLSYLPPAAADRYVRAFGRADSYYERFRTRRGLQQLLAGWHVVDYTLPVLGDPAAFSGEDMVPAMVSRLPERALAATLPLVPTYVWVASPSPLRPAGPALRVAPRPVPTPAR
ncbi:MAG: class I SAM-dependent methyltransferase [Rhodoferax sp.]|nr:class I SAM-dependent methyltransferase [Actinomycetota bacterium]